MTPVKALRGAIRRGKHGVRRSVHGVYTRWRRSIQLRVVAITLVISGCVVALLGVFLMEQTKGALLESTEKSALQQFEEGLALAQRENASLSTDDDDRYRHFLGKLSDTLAQRSGPSGLYEVVILDPSHQSDAEGYASSVDETSVPQRLRDRVRRSTTATPYQTYGRLRFKSERPSVRGLILGARQGGVEIYYLFPLNQEQEAITSVQRTLTGVGASLVLLLAAIAWLVTRQVVIPVRLAAGSAERLSTGRLSERMRVRGEDDIARLATSFNDMAANLQEKITALESLSQAQRQFASDVSHELRTPLTTIRMAADLLHARRGEYDESAARAAELLQEQLERFESLLADLLEISRHDAGKATLDAERADVREIVQRAIGDAEGLAERKGCKIVQRLPGEPCMADIDRRRVERVLRNLLVNAVDHSEGRDVVVTVGADRDAVAVTVRDHGVGLKPGQSQLVFDRFWRADPARARSTGGTGLGLSISKEDARLHGGWLQAWGRAGQGSQFRLTLPRTAGAELRGSPLPLAPPESGLGRAPFTGLAAAPDGPPESTDQTQEAGR